MRLALPPNEIHYSSRGERSPIARSGDASWGRPPRPVLHAERIRHGDRAQHEYAAAAAVLPPCRDGFAAPDAGVRAGRCSGRLPTWTRRAVVRAGAASRWLASGRSGIPGLPAATTTATTTVDPAAVRRLHRDAGPRAACGSAVRKRCHQQRSGSGRPQPAAADLVRTASSAHWPSPRRPTVSPRFRSKLAPRSHSPSTPDRMVP